MSEDKNTDLNLAEMSDEEIANLDPRRFGDQAKDAGSDVDSEIDQSATSAGSEDNDSRDTGGAGSEDDSSKPDTGGADSTSAEESTDTGNDERTPYESAPTSKDNQSKEKGAKEEGTTEESSSNVDYKAEYERVMAPFKAAKKEITVNNVDDVRRLMQMGADYSRKMEAMKPYQRVLKTLEQNDLMSEEKVNFIIDLMSKKPEAVKKFFKDSEIDPMDLDLEDNSEYRPTDHIVGDHELVLEEVIDSIRETPSFNRTVTVITKEWDNASRQLLKDNPQVIGFVNEHMEAGIYDKIADRVSSERMFGRIPAGLSDLEAYKQVGDAMAANGEFGSPTGQRTTPSGDTGQDFSQDPNGSEHDRENVNARKKAASPTKGNASARKQAPNFLAMTDEEIANFDPRSL